MAEKHSADLRTVIVDTGILTAIYNRFHKETGKESFRDFLTYLREKGLIDEESFRGSTPPQMAGASSKAFEMGRYEVLETIAEGGMGVIRLANDPSLRRKVAMKLLRRELMSPALIERFTMEAQLTAQIDHPNVTPVYSLQVDSNGTVSFAMKLIRGKTLHDLIEEARRACESDPRRPLDAEHSLTTRLEHFLKVSDAMSYAHSKGVIHCDLKPANIMVGAFREVYVMDWGLARLIPGAQEGSEGLVDLAEGEHDPALHKARDGGIAGTPEYMSPRQAMGLNTELDAQSDVYSLGIMLFELATLKRAVTGANVREIQRKAVEGKLEPLVHRNPRVRIASELKAIIRKATSLQPQDRYGSVDELARDIRRHLRGDEVLARPDNAFQKLLRWMAKHRLLTLWLVLAVVSVSAVATIWSLYQEKTAVERARFRENRLAGYLTAVAAQSQRIDRHLLRLETMLASLADTATYLMAQGTPSDEPTFSHVSFRDKQTAPPDLSLSSLYRKEISTDYPVYKLAPGVTLDAVMPKLKRLMPLRHRFKKMLLNSRPKVNSVTEQEARRFLTEEGVPIRWAYIGLAEGVMFSYPGKATYPDEYDPRLRPWYKLGLGHRTPTWGNPYVDLQGQGLILPCVVSLYDVDGKFYGVAGAEVTFDDIIETFMVPAEERGVLETFILDEQGRIVVGSSQHGKRFGSGELHDALELTAFPTVPVVDAIRRGASGHVEVQEDGRTLLIAYYRIPTLAWYYVEKVLLSRILAH